MIRRLTNSELEPGMRVANGYAVYELQSKIREYLDTWDVIILHHSFLPKTVGKMTQLSLPKSNQPQMFEWYNFFGDGGGVPG